MGLNKSIYLDTCIVIYLVEEHEKYFKQIETRLNTESQIICFNALVELESLAIPTRLHSQPLLTKYKNFFSRYNYLDITQETFHLATELRASYKIKTSDAIHLATAKLNHCSEFWTNDNRLTEIAFDLAINICER